MFIQNLFHSLKQRNLKTLCPRMAMYTGFSSGILLKQSSSRKFPMFGSQVHSLTELQNMKVTFSARYVIRGGLSKPLSTDNFNIVQEWYLEIPIETQVFLENFINKDTVRRHKDPDSFVKTKLEKLYSIQDVLLNLHNKKFTGVFQKSNSSKLLIEYESVGSVFDITSGAGATSSLSQAENQVKSGTCKDLCYYNTYLRDNSPAYQTVGGENKSCVNLRSCHLILMLDNLVRLQYIADPNPSEHRSKQLCTLPITLQGLPLDTTITQELHLADCNGDLNCSCKQPVLLKKDDIQRVLLKSDQNEKMLYTQFFNLMTFGYPVLWKKLPGQLIVIVSHIHLQYSFDSSYVLLINEQNILYFTFVLHMNTTGAFVNKFRIFDPLEARKTPKK